MINKKDLSSIGLGAWGLGGFAEKDPKNDDEKQLEALVHSLKKGINFIEINFWNSQGKSVELISKAIKISKVPRDRLFYILVIYDYNLPTIKAVRKEIESYFKLFETDWIDSLEFIMTTFRTYGFNEVVRLTHDYLNKGKARYTSLTNCNLEYLKKYHEVFKNKLFSHELHYSFEIRDNEDLDITSYAQNNNILNVIYQPLRRNRTAKRNWPILVELSKKYKKTQNQIILNWLVSKGFLPIVKSESIRHIDENIQSLEFELEKGDFEKLESFQIPGYKTPEIDWNRSGKGVAIHMLPNIIDEIIDNKKQFSS